MADEFLDKIRDALEAPIVRSELSFIITYIYE